MSEEESAAIGWPSIDEALERLYGDQEPPHWHFVSYGMSELYEKESKTPEISGWGFEFTLRLRRGGESEPPAWALSFLNNLARYVFQTGNTLDVGHHIDPSDKIAWRAEGDALVICLPTGYCSRSCQGLAIRRGRYRWDDLPGLELTVLPSEIKDRAGKIVEVIG